MKHKRLLHGAVLGILLLAITGLAGHARAQSITQGYKSSGDVQNGMIVHFKAGVAGTVEPLSQKYELSMLGVTVANIESPVSLSNSAETQVYVATFGEYTVLVSTQNGPIKAGDRLSVSSIDGIAMKSDNDRQVILGKALQDFADTSNANGHVSLKGAGSVAIGRILVDVGVARNPGYSADAVANVPTFLVKAARAVSDKPITALRLYSGLAILFVAIVVAGMVLFAGARSGMSAVGRNPLAKKSIFKSMISVVLMALIIVSLGLVAVYLLLKI